MGKIGKPINNQSGLMYNTDFLLLNDHKIVFVEDFKDEGMNLLSFPLLMRVFYFIQSF